MMAQFTLPLDIKSLEITSQTLNSKGNIVFTVVSTCTQTSCHKCGKSAKKRYGYTPFIEVRHTSILDTAVILRIKPVRYECEYCDDHTTTTEQYDWVAKGGKITKGLEEYLLRCVINSTIQDVAIKEMISYRTVKTMLDYAISTEVDWNLYTDLSTIGIDEVSNRKGYKDFVAIISARDKWGDLSILAVLDNRKKETVLAFLESIPEHLKKTVKSVCTDMYDGFVNAAIEVFGQQAVVVDRYHVSKLYRKPLDDLRIKEMARLKRTLSADEYKKLEGMMWILRKQHECLTEDNKTQLELLYKHSPMLKQAHSYALKLTHIFNTHSTRKDAVAKINRWISKVQDSELTCFNTFIGTLSKYKPSIANYFKDRRNSGFVEGLNNKIKVVKRRCYGFFKTESLFQRLTLDLSGYSMLGF
jgi:transposase